MKRGEKELSLELHLKGTFPHPPLDVQRKHSRSTQGRDNAYGSVKKTQAHQGGERASICVIVTVTLQACDSQAECSAEFHQSSPISKSKAFVQKSYLLIPSVFCV